MKHLLYTMSALSILLLACGNQKKENNAKTSIISSSLNTSETNGSEN